MYCMSVFTSINLHTVPDRTRATLQVTMALVVLPAPRAFPTRTQAAAWIPRGNCKDAILHFGVSYNQMHSSLKGSLKNIRLYFLSESMMKRSKSS